MREPIRFDINAPVELAFAYGTGKRLETKYGPRVMYTTVGNGVLFAGPELAAEIAKASPRARTPVWITKQLRWVTEDGRRRQWIRWLVTETRPAIHEPGPNRKPGDSQAAAAATGLPETQLERFAREAAEVREMAARNIRARINLERRP